MKILVIQESDWLERGPHQSHHLMERLSERGHKVRVIDYEIGWRSRTVGSLLSKRKVISGVHKIVETARITVIRPSFLCIPILDYLTAFTTHWLEIRRQIHEFRPDVVVGFGILNAFHGIRTTRRHRIPFVYYLIDELHRLVPERRFRGLARLLESYNMRNSSLVLSINEMLRLYTVAMGASEEKTQIIPAGIDLEEFDQSNGGLAVRRKHGIGPNDLVLLFMGWLYPFSGLTNVAKEVVRRPDGDLQVKLLVVGTGELWGELERLRANSDHPERIILVGWQPYHEIPSLVSAADICLLPAQPNEVMTNIVPIKMYEYMAAGKPVLATRLPGLLTEFGENHGVLYINESQEAVPLALRLAQNGTLKPLGRKAREFVASNDWNTITDRFEVALMYRAGTA